jgi:dTDP-4-dehydrorhamnose 3,5-epimerase
MKISQLELNGLLLVELKVYGDSRGFFVERFNEKLFAENGLPTRFVQDNHSRSAPGVLRGLHYQTEPAQGKLIGVARGKIWDIAVDIRAHSPTYGKWSAFELSDENGKMLWIPPGFAHGFCVLGDGPADVIYKVDGFYNPKSEGGIHWADPEFNIPWPVKNPTISARDEVLPKFSVYRANPVRW